jgi:putative phosphoesterase
MSPAAKRSHLVGLISDTHGLVRPEVFDALSGVELILHAGDVGEGVLEELQTIAPVEAVFGNTDDPGDPQLTAAIERTIGGARIHVSHGHELGSPTPERLLAKYDADVIVYGHTHQQKVVEKDGRLVVNPGAAGPRRFRLQPSVGLLTIADGQARVQIIEIETEARPGTRSGRS